MMNGYRNFAEDVKLAFDGYLNHRGVAVKYESWFKGEFCHSVILESVSQYLDFYVDAGSLVVSIIDKSTLEFMELDELILFLNPGIDLKSEKSRYFHHNYYEDARKNGKDTSEQAAVIVRHLCLGELNAYAKIIDEYLHETVFTDSHPWPEKVKNTGRALYISKAEWIHHAS